MHILHITHTTTKQLQFTEIPHIKFGMTKTRVVILTKRGGGRIYKKHTIMDIPSASKFAIGKTEYPPMYNEDFDTSPINI